MPNVASRPKKTPTNVSIRSDLVQRAKALKLNLSRLFERALEAELEERERAEWRERNAGAIDEYNARVAERGVFSDEWRRF